MSLPSPSFSLKNYDGTTVTQANLTGKPTLVAFLFTNCPDICPVISSKLKDLSDLAEKDKVDFNIVAISVDPVGDTADSVKAYSEKMRMAGRWRYLIGSFGDLQPVWKGYAVNPGLNDPGIGHTDAVWLQDGQGMRRVLFRSDFDAKDVLAAIKKLR